MNRTTIYSNRLVICEHAKSGKCSGVFSNTGKFCGHQILHEKRKFMVGFCTDEGKIEYSKAKKLGLKSPRTCYPGKLIEEIIDDKLFEI